ncbi:MAG: ABC transporter permease subunit [Phycisphaerales bacterium]|nr:ABC transporter permease subunit [Phycisphaerales bacterium]
MTGIGSRLWLSVWRLIPANPILVRVVFGASRRVRHLWIRVAYLAFLLLVVLIAQVSGPGGSTLVDLAKNASVMFKWASITQLALMCFLAPVFAAAAITQERDAQTFNILISTPLSNAQIVLGSLMSRLYFVLMLLVGGLPIFLVMMIYGGVTFAQIMQSFAIAGATAILTGSLAICISMIRVGTRRTILSFYVMIGLYLIAVWFSARQPNTWIAEAPTDTNGRQLSWLAAFHPLLALDVALNSMPAPDPSVLGGRSAITRYVLAYPQRAYVMISLFVSLILTVVAMFFVRQPKEGEVGMLSALAARLLRREVGERRRKPRHVWNNPVAWREATTRASATTRGLLDVLLLGGGIAAAIYVLVDHLRTGNPFATRGLLNIIVLTELGLILLAATNTAATAMTKEKESNAMDLLLATPLTSRYIVLGKLRGLVTFTLPLIAVPVLTVLILAIGDLLKKSGPTTVPIEAPFEMVGLMLAYSAAACLFGLYISLYCRKTVKAVMLSVGIIVLFCLLTTLIGDAVVEGSGPWSALFAPLFPFTGIGALVDPAIFRSPVGGTPTAHTEHRTAAAIGAAVTITIYLLAVLGGYRSMVRNFDWVMRKQSGQA